LQERDEIRPLLRRQLHREPLIVEILQRRAAAVRVVDVDRLELTGFVRRREKHRRLVSPGGHDERQRGSDHLRGDGLSCNHPESSQ
jgi:hypothetical protein